MQCVAIIYIQQHGTTQHTSSGIFHDIDSKLYDITGEDLMVLTLLRALTEALVVDEGAIATLGVLQQELPTQNV